MKSAYLLAITCGIFLAVPFAGAQETAQFTNKLSIGFTMTDGNSDTMQANASLISEGEKKGLGSVRSGIEANYGKSTVEETTIDADGNETMEERDSTTVDNAKIFGNVKKTMSEMTFGYLDASTLYDDIAKIDYRTTVGPGLGAYLVKSDMTSLSAEAGPSYIWEKVSDVSDNYLALRFGERLTYKISATANIWQSLEYLPQASDFGDYLLNGEIGAESALNKRMSLRLVVQNKYDSTPGADLEENDLTIIAGIGVTL